MPDIDFEALEDGTPLTAENINSRLTSLQTAINDLSKDAPQRGAFNENHLPSLVVDKQFTNFNGACDNITGANPAVWINVVQGGNDLAVAFSPGIDLRASGGCRGLFVRASLTVSTTASGSSATTDYIEFRIQFETGAGWTTLDRTLRWVWRYDAAAANFYLDIPITTLITSVDNPALALITGVRVQAAAYTAGAFVVGLEDCQLFALALQAGI